MEEFKVRPATPEDADFLAWILYAASRSHLPFSLFEFALGVDKETLMPIFKDLVLADPSLKLFTCWEGFIIGEVDGKPVAALSGYDPKEKNVGQFFAYYHDMVFKKLGWGEKEIADMTERTQGFSAVFVTHDDASWTVEWVACLPEHRGKGYIDKLLLEILARGREKGFKKAMVTFMTGNTSAEKAYKRVGFKDWNAVSSPLWQRHIPCPGVSSVTMSL